MTEPARTVLLEIGDEVCLVYGIKVRIKNIIQGEDDDLIVAEVIEDEKVPSA